jgi:hypothetical protein
MTKWECIESNSMDIDLFSTNLLDEIQISVLLIETESSGGIWSFGEHSMTFYIWVADRFSKRHMRCIREEDNKSNIQIMDKLLVQMSLLVLY